MNIAIYVRVSTKDGKQDTALQLDSILSFIERRGWTAHPRAVYEEMESSKKHRPILDRLWRDCQQGKVDLLIIYKLDRLSRTVAEFVNQWGELNRMGVKFISATQPMLDSTNTDPMSVAFMQLMAVFAELEHGLTMQRVRDGIESAKRRGVKLGRKRVETVDDKVVGLIDMVTTGKISQRRAIYEIQQIQPKLSSTTIRRRIAERRKIKATRETTGC